MIESIQESVSFLKDHGVGAPEVGVILGTGLGHRFVDLIEDGNFLDYASIPHFPVSTVEFHKGKFHFGTVGGKRVCAMEGRFHYYEGYSMQQITFPVRVMKMLGIKHLLISNAAGNLNRAWEKGDLMMLDDHINLLPENPLRGANIAELGPRFPDMSEPYSKILNQKLTTLANEAGINLRQGVYAAVTGPNLETRAEYRYLQRIGADAVGMSTVPEAIVAAHMGLPCCAISVLTDDCDPDNLQSVSIHEILEIAARAEEPLSKLYASLIAAL